MIEVEATMRQNYNAKSFRVGDTIVINSGDDAADEREVADLVAMRMAVRKPTPVAVHAPINRAIDTGSDAEQQTASVSGKGKDEYKRRDMRAAK